MTIEVYLLLAIACLLGVLVGSVAFVAIALDRLGRSAASAPAQASPVQGEAFPVKPAQPADPDNWNYLHMSEVELLLNGQHHSWRAIGHPDIAEAIAAPGMSVRHPDGTVEG